jgi:osmoprotectant transport system permease protein
VDPGEGGLMNTTLAFLGQFGDAVDFILHKRESQGGGVQIGGSEMLDLTWQHLKLSGVALGVASLVAVPLGLWLGHIRRFSFFAISVSNVGRAVPTLALLAFFAAYLGLGFSNVAFALVLLAIPPILTNTYVGIYQVDRDMVDAARGMGMRGHEIVRQVELPLALPTLAGGIRTSAVNVIATATIAPLAGVTSLGFPILSPQIYGPAGQIGAAIVVAVLAVSADVLLGVIQRALTPTGVKLEAGDRRRRAPAAFRKRGVSTA